MFTFKTRKGKYYDTITQVAWEAWQAAREQVTEQRDRLAEALRKIKNEQPT
jgi:Fe-S cluster biosynthesis and repair protein YggX